MDNSARLRSLSLFMHIKLFSMRNFPTCKKLPVVNTDCLSLKRSPGLIPQGAPRWGQQLPGRAAAQWRTEGSCQALSARLPLVATSPLQDNSGTLGPGARCSPPKFSSQYIYLHLAPAQQSTLHLRHFPSSSSSTNVQSISEALLM